MVGWIGRAGDKVKSKPLHTLTPLEVKNAGEGEHFDGGMLFLRVRYGRCNWVFRYTAPNGRRREMGLGQCDRVNLKQAGASLVLARDLAHEARQLLRRGVDPIEAREQQRDAARQVDEQQRTKRARDRWTLARCARDYHERVIEPARSTKHSAQWIATLEHHVPAKLWSRPIVEIDAPALLDALRRVKPHPSARNVTNLGATLHRVRQRLEVVWDDAIFHGRATTNPAATIKRKLTEGRPPAERGAFRALDYRAAPALMARLRAMPGTAARALEFAVLTAARTGEVIEAAWSEIDAPAAEWRVPGERMKGGAAHVAYLPPRALEIVRAQVGQSDEWVFPSPASVGTEQTRPLSNMALLAVLNRLGVRDQTTVHGLCRATFSTWANETGAARPDAIEATLAHSEADRVRKAYNRAEFAAERRALLAAWADYLSRPAALAVVEKGGAQAA